MKIKYLLIFEILLAFFIDQMTSTSPTVVVIDRTAASRRKIAHEGDRALWKTNGASVNECYGYLRVFTGGKICKSKVNKSIKRDEVKNTLSW